MTALAPQTLLKFPLIHRGSLPVSTQKLFLLVPLNARNSHRGTTLIEMLIATVITGILAAVAMPSLIALLNGNNVKSGLDQVQGALRDAQRQAIRLSLQCTVNFGQDASGKLTKISASSNSCIPSTSSSLPSGVVMKNKQTISGTTTLTDSPISISFSFKGNTTTSQTIVIASSDNKTEKRCLAISNGLGIMRTGTYKDSDNSCNTSL